MQYMTIDVSDGECTMRSKRLCTSPDQFRNILADELLRFAAAPCYRLIWDSIPLQQVRQELDLHMVPPEDFDPDFGYDDAEGEYPTFI